MTDESSRLIRSHDLGQVCKSFQSVLGTQLKGEKKPKQERSCDQAMFYEESCSVADAPQTYIRPDPHSLMKNKENHF